MSSVIEVDFDFIASIAGRRVHGAEVDAMARCSFLVDGGHQPRKALVRQLPTGGASWMMLSSQFQPRGPVPSFMRSNEKWRDIPSTLPARPFAAGMGSRGNTAKPGRFRLLYLDRLTSWRRLLSGSSVHGSRFRMSSVGDLQSPAARLFSPSTTTVTPITTLTTYAEWLPFVENCGWGQSRQYALCYLTADGQTAEQPIYFEPYGEFRGYRDRATVASGRPLYFTIAPESGLDRVPDSGCELHGSSELPHQTRKCGPVLTVRLILRTTRALAWACRITAGRDRVARCSFMGRNPWRREHVCCSR